MITAHCIVKNEENFVWYAVSSVIDYVDKIMVWDTGSTDRTVEIIKEIKNQKILFEDKGPADLYKFAKLRDEMVKITDTDWIFILDGDEIWPKAGIEEIIDLITKYGDSKDLIVSPVKMLIGDIYHHQEERAGRYKIKGKMGHFNIRAIRNFEGLRVKGYFGNEGYTDKNNTDIQNFPNERIIFAKNDYFHASHLKRSKKANLKYKYELGIPFPKDFYYPEVFFEPRPVIVPSPWKEMSHIYKIRALVETPIKKIKRRII